MRLIQKINIVKNKVLLFVLLFSFNILSLFSQQCSDFPELKKYRNFSISIGGRIYKKAEKIIQYGNYKSISLNSITYSFGLDYELFISNKWSVKTGLLFSKVPFENEIITILQKDVYSGFERDIVNPMRSFSHLCFSIPLTIQYKLKLFNNNYLSLNAGGIVLNMLPSVSETSVRARISEDIMAEVYASYLISTGRYFHGGFTTGCSYYLDLNKVLLEFKFTYVAMFQNLFEGEYQFGNLLVSPPTRGYYNISGDYLEFSVSTHFLKSKKRRN